MTYVVNERFVVWDAETTAIKPNVRKIHIHRTVRMSGILFRNAM